MVVLSTAVNCADLLKRLEKKSSFQQALSGVLLEVKGVSSSNPSHPEQLALLFPVISRCFQLLRTRYSNPQYWKDGLLLFEGCEGVPFTPEKAGKIRSYAQEAHSFLTSNDVEVPVTGDNSSLADVLLGVSDSRDNAETHFDDAGPIVDDEERWRRAQTSGTSDSAGDGTAPAASAAASRRAQRAELQQAILEGIQAVYSGMESIARSTEAVERELDNMLGALASQQQQRPSRPPASRRVMAQLPRIVLDDDKLQEMGRDTVCAVCTETLKVGDEVQQLPCKHCYHVPCVAPWLAQNNSCPTCRQELPTDDAKYEAAKERAAEEEADRKGAANALSHNEFQYI